TGETGKDAPAERHDTGSIHDEGDGDHPKEKEDADVANSFISGTDHEPGENVGQAERADDGPAVLVIASCCSLLNRRQRLTWLKIQGARPFDAIRPVAAPKSSLVATSVI